MKRSACIDVWHGLTLGVGLGVVMWLLALLVSGVL